MTTYLSAYAVPGVNILLHLNGQLVAPEEGFLSVLTTGTKITITVEVVGKVEHQCYTIDSRMERTPKTSSEPGIYTKRLTVIKKQTSDGTITTQVAGWPNNMICLDIHGKTYNIGVFTQNGRYFFCIHERVSPIETNSALPIGFITHFDPLRGIARVFTGSIIQDAKLHVSKMPFRKKLGFRAVVPGEVIKFTARDIRNTGTENTTYSQEIMRCTI